MTDMDALDRLIASEVDRATAPSRPVDDAAIFAAITTSRTPRLRIGFAFSAARYVMALGILALFGGFLLTGILATPRTDDDPAAVTASPSPTVVGGSGSAFPTGTFVSEADGHTLEFRADGTCLRDGTPCTFGLSGRIYTEMTSEDASGPRAPAAYLWRFDGGRLTFERKDIDPRPDRLDTYLNHAYRPEGETGALPAQETGFPTGWFVAADHPETRMNITDDGLWSVIGWIDDGDEAGAYAVNGNLFTTSGREGFADYTAATFYWDWDGERLSFRPWAEAGDASWPQMDEVWIRDVPPSRRLSLSAPNLDYFVTVEISVLADGRYSATGTILEGFDEKPLGEGVGDTPQEAVHAALEDLGEPTASDLAEKVPG